MNRRRHLGCGGSSATFYTGPFADYLVKKNVAWWIKGPAAAITAPENCATFTAPASVSMTASATDNSGTITKVEFYSGATKLGETTAAPYAFTWNGVEVGTYALTAKAINNAGASYTSYPVSGTNGTVNGGQGRKRFSRAELREIRKNRAAVRLAHTISIDTRRLFLYSARVVRFLVLPDGPP